MGSTQSNNKNPIVPVGPTGPTEPTEHIVPIETVGPTEHMFPIETVGPTGPTGTNNVIEELEKKGEEKVKEIFANTNSKQITSGELQSTLVSIMTDGADEFEKRTGRKMTYAEMRSVWG